MVYLPSSNITDCFVLGRIPRCVFRNARGKTNGDGLVSVGLSWEWLEELLILCAQTVLIYTQKTQQRVHVEVSHFG